MTLEVGASVEIVRGDHRGAYGEIVRVYSIDDIPSREWMYDVWLDERLITIFVASWSLRRLSLLEELVWNG